MNINRYNFENCTQLHRLLRKIAILGVVIGSYHRVPIFPELTISVISTKNSAPVNTPVINPKFVPRMVSNFLYTIRSVMPFVWVTRKHTVIYRVQWRRQRQMFLIKSPSKTTCAYLCWKLIKIYELKNAFIREMCETISFCMRIFKCRPHGSALSFCTTARKMSANIRLNILPTLSNRQISLYDYKF